MKLNTHLRSAAFARQMIAGLACALCAIALPMTAIAQENAPPPPPAAESAPPAPQLDGSEGELPPAPALKDAGSDTPLPPPPPRRERRGPEGDRPFGPRSQGGHMDRPQHGMDRGPGMHGPGMPPPPPRFEDFDANGDGNVTRDEFDAAIARGPKHGPMHGPKHGPDGHGGGFDERGGPGRGDCPRQDFDQDRPPRPERPQGPPPPR